MEIERLRGFNARMGMKHMETGGIIIVVSSCNSEGFA
jgi:hypothetical protein